MMDDGAARAAQFINLVPPLAVAESVLILGEPFSPSLLVGTVLVVAGALWPLNPSAIAGALLGTIAGNPTNSGALGRRVSAGGSAALAAPAPDQRSMTMPCPST